MKKILLIGVLIFFLTGCSVDYEINFGEKIDEKIVFNFDEDIYKTAESIDGDSFYIEDVLVYENIPSLVGFKDYYDKTIDVIGNKSVVTLKYEYNYDNFADSYLINECFEKSSIINGDDYYYVSLGGDFNCFDAQGVTIKIKSDYEITKDNAKEIKGDYRIWEIEDQNEAKEIEIYFSKTLISQKNTGVKFNWKIIAGIVISLVVGAFFFIKKRLLNQ